MNSGHFFWIKMEVRMKTVLLAVLCFSFFVSSASAASSEQTATGVAKDYDQALSAALFNAVQQANGAKLSKVASIKAELDQVVTESTSGSGTETSTKLNLGVQDRIVTSGTKYLESYQVSSVKPPAIEGDNWQVTVKAMIPEYESLIDDAGRPSIAVMPFRFSHPTFAVHNGQAASNSFQLSSRMKDKLVSSLTQTQYFVVVQRADTSSLSKEFLSEAALLSSDAVSAEEASRFGRVVGADYMMTGRIHELRSETEVTAFYGMKKERTEDQIDISFQVVEVATQKVLWADTITTDFDRPEDAGVSVTLDYVAKLVTDSTMTHLDPTYVSKSNIGEQEDKKTNAPDKGRTHLSDTPGSSDAPIKWN
ncbi:hypothetical protein A3765_08550 [Oleiphilus sp. HI0130]|nr:hypothetical protein A3758_03785 [Oleiphilus sp. HI0118]KZZ44262.1 hypothetical protein A3758_18950 [Oleiphilus sp. HI0118]KZZ78022.1 hypothetical protein A3765_08550 [Oleiphilus sp. HI0130]